jgi:hypothetical protein
MCTQEGFREKGKCVEIRVEGRGVRPWQYGWKEEECDHMGGKKISETGSGADEVKGLPLH